jgi:hypothetical protein
VVKPVRSHDVLSRGQVDLINCEAYADGEFKYIMNYQDHVTKFVHLYPLKTKTAAEVAWHLLEIFLSFGALVILQSDNGKEFVASVISELKQLWPDLKIVHGRPRRPQSQGRVERSNGEIKKNWECGFAIINLLNCPLGINFFNFSIIQLLIEILNVLLLKLPLVLNL